jgi:hypothetical protein
LEGKRGAVTKKRQSERIRGVVKLLKNADPRGCEGRQNALFVRADCFVLHAGSALVRGGRDLAASPIFRGIGLQSIEPPKSNRLFVFQKIQGKTQLSEMAKIC